MLVNDRALLMLSGGLDSILACRLLQEQHVIIEGIHFSTPFMKDLYWPRKAADLLGIPTKFVRIGDEFIDIVREPVHGYGSNLNPCIDCRIMMLRLAKEYMGEIGATFIITGEVVGERPMTQNRNTMRMIEKRAELNGLILRPLTAKLLLPSTPEREGIVSRGLLLGLSGRGRKAQLELARRYGIDDVPTPAGGCVLTDPSFSRRVRDLMEHGELTAGNVRLLLYGRHFRLPSGGKVIVGRNHADNGGLLQNALPGDYIFRVRDGGGPVAVLRSGQPQDIAVAADLCARYARGDGVMDVLYKRKKEDSYSSLEANPSPGELHIRYLI